MRGQIPVAVAERLEFPRTTGRWPQLDKPSGEIHSICERIVVPISALNANEAADHLLGMTNLFSMTMDRRHARPPGEPTRLQHFLLAAILRREGMALSDLAPLLDVSPATASQMVGTMEARGWVARGFDPKDHRRHVVHVTEAGAAVVQRSRQRQRARLVAVLEQLTAEERAELVRLAERVASVVMRAGPPAGESGDLGQHSRGGKIGVADDQQ